MPAAAAPLYHRVSDDPAGLIFIRWQAKQGEVLAINSSELRAVQGRQACDFVLHPICLRCKPGRPCAQCQAGKRARPPQLRETHGHTVKKAKGAQVEARFDPKQRWAVDPEIDRDTRRDCEGT